MNEAELDKSVARLMERVDYYLHCELDDEYDHEQPETARTLLQAALRTELLRASAIGLLSTVGAPAHTLPNSDAA